MRIILLQDVRGIGKKNDVKDVSDGYAKNYLLPRKLGEPAVPKALAAVAEIKARQGAKHAEATARLAALADTLKAEKLVFSVKAGEKGSAFGSITKDMIVSALRTRGRLGPDDRVDVELEHPLKELGEHEVALRLPHGTRAVCTVILQRQP
jgi:large subunit ribosomal protein L9